MDGDSTLFPDQFDFYRIGLSFFFQRGELRIDDSRISVGIDGFVATGFDNHHSAVKSFLRVKRTVFHPCLINPVEGPDPFRFVILLTFWEGGRIGSLFLGLDTQLGT